MSFWRSFWTVSGIPTDDVPYVEYEARQQIVGEPDCARVRLLELFADYCKSRRWFDLLEGLLNNHPMRTHQVGENLVEHPLFKRDQFPREAQRSTCLC